MTGLFLKIRTFFNSLQIAFKKMWKDVKKRKIFIIVTSAVMAVIITTVTLCCVFLIPEKEREITLYMHGFDGVEEVIKINNKDKFTLPTLQKEYYDFLGWYFDKEYTEPVPENYFKDYDYTRDARVYSKWNMRNPVIITFYSQGGTAVEQEVVPAGKPIDKSWFSQREGYTLVGWCYDENLLTIFMPGDSFSENTRLYAKWLPNEITEEDTVTITFDTNGGDPVENQIIKIGGTITLPATNRVGYDFLGWYTDPEFKFPYKSSATVAKSVTLYAKWKENVVYYIITFNTRGGDALESISYMNGTKINVSLLKKPTKQGDIFDCWCMDSDVQYKQPNDFVIKDNVTLYARWQSDTPVEIEYVNIYYHYDQDSVPNKIVIEKHTKIPADISTERGGYIFEGWFADPELKNAFDFNVMAYEDTHLYAKWTARPYYSDELFAYELSEDETYLILVKRLDKVSTSVTIPDECKGLPIKEIGANAFNGSIVTNVTIGKNITKINENAFTDSLLEQIIIPKNVVEIHDYAFYGAGQLTAVEIEGDTWIRDYSFAECSRLKTFTANSVTKIERFAFQNCIGLTTVKINKIASLGVNGTFIGCRSLSSVSMTNATLTEIPSRTFQDTMSLKEIVIPSTVTDIDSEAFSGSGLTLLDTKNVKEIGNGAFSGCSMLNTVYIRASVNNIAETAFINCHKATFYVDASNTLYDDYNGSLYTEGKVQLLHYKDTGATSFTLPASVMKIGMGAFVTASSLESISVENGNVAFKAIDGCLYSIDEQIMYLYPQKKQGSSFTVRNGVVKINKLCFYNNSNLESVVLPYSTLAVEPIGFYNLKNLTEIKYRNANIIGNYDDNNDVGGLTVGNNGGVVDCGGGNITFTQIA